MSNNLKAIANNLPEFVLLPVNENKQATIKGWQKRTKHPTNEELEQWEQKGFYSVGVLCGVSGLEVLDFDNKDNTGSKWTLFHDMVEPNVSPGLLDSLPLITTPSGGHHLYYRCNNPEQSQELAQTEDNKVIVETRGSAAYVVAPGTVLPDGREYKQIQGDDLAMGFSSVPLITDEDRQQLFIAATLLNRKPLQEKQIIRGNSEFNRPGDIFNQKADWEQDVLFPAGWTCLRERGAVREYIRPGKTRGLSATTGYCGDLLYVFSTSTPLEANKAHTKFSAYTFLFHNGDFSKAAMDLVQKGYVSQQVIESDFVEPPRWDKVQFPVKYLPSPMRELVEEVADLRKVDPGIPATAALAVIAGSIGNLAQINTANYRKVGSALQFIMMGTSGSFKSVCSAPFNEPFFEYQSGVNENYLRNIQPKYKNEIQCINAELQGIRTGITNIYAGKSKLSPGEQEIQVQDKKIRAEVLELRKKELQMNRTGAPWIVSDITPERMAAQMQQTNGRISILGSEAKAIANFLGLTYGKGSQMEAFVKGYDREDWTKYRMGTDPDGLDNSITVYSPDITFVSSYTPVPFRQMLKKPEFRASGFLSRCLLIQTHKNENDIIQGTTNPETCNKWSATVKELCSIPVPLNDYRRPAPLTVPFDSAMERDYIQYINSFRKWVRNKDNNEEINWTERVDVQILHLALGFHLLRYKQDYAEKFLQEEDLNRAKNVYCYYVAQILNFLTELDTNTTSKDMDTLMSYVEKKGSITKNDANRNIWWHGTGTKAENATNNLNEAVSRGWLVYHSDTKSYTVSQAYKQYKETNNVK